jgi:hypothetical protein
MPMTAGPHAVRDAFALLCLCCTPGADSEGGAEALAIGAAAARVDWPTFAALAHRHRVEALALRALARARVAMPADIRADLKAAARRIAHKAMMLAAETRRLVDAAEAAGLEPVVLKGTPLALLAYGEVHLKHAKDVDLVVAPPQRDAMRAVLQGAGYRQARGVTGKDEAWMDPGSGNEVELHTSLVDHAAWLRGLAPGAGLRRVRVGEGRGLPTLAPDDLHAYLSTHGAVHGWSRLKWLADLAALLARRTPEEVVALHRHAVALGAERASAEALLLCHALLGLALPAGFAAELARSPAVRWLVADVRRSFVGRHALVELDMRALATLRIHVAQLVTMRGWRARAALADAKIGGWRRSPVTVHRWLWRRLRQSRQLASAAE